MYKQIIIARKDLDMSPGKLAAQVSHGSMAFLTTMIRRNAIENHPYRYRSMEIDDELLCKPIPYRHNDLYRMANEAVKQGEAFFCAKPADPQNPYGKLEECEDVKEYKLNFAIDGDLYEQWINAAFTKCVLQAKNKTQLMKAVTIAENLGMREGQDFFLIRDNCYTELEPEDEDGRTLTCIGFKPMEAKVIDQIGKKFHLYV